LSEEKKLLIRAVIKEIAVFTPMVSRGGSRRKGFRRPMSCSSDTSVALRKRFRTACKSLGAVRLESLTIHHGRHTFISHALAGGRTLAEVRDAAGHCNVSITSGYLHVAVDDDAMLGKLFRFTGEIC
jgi:integrase